jgi:hypothetical protein
MWPLFLRNPIGRKIPHLRIWITLHVLQHAQESGLGRVFPIAHIPEFLKVRLHVLCRMLAAIPGSGACLTTTLQFDIHFITVTDICLLHLNHFFGEIVQLLEIVARVGNGVGLKSYTSISPIRIEAQILLYPASE